MVCGGSWRSVVGSGGWGFLSVVVISGLILTFFPFSKSLDAIPDYMLHLMK